MIKNLFHCMLTVGLVFAISFQVTAGQPEEKDKEIIVTDPAKGGVDFKLQGEYSGTVNGNGAQHKIGVQVIALGGGKFRAVGYPGGLPGDGWNGSDRHESDGELTGETVTFQSKDPRNNVAGVLSIDRTIKAQDNDGNVIATLKKVNRKSPTLGKKPPQGAIVLFDGKGADNFTDGKATENGHLMAGCESKQKFGDHSLHVEFRTPFKPYGRGQGRGNSGVYVQSRYEIQVLDSFGLTGESNECGGIYKIAKPEVNACFPPLSWQAYDIDFTAARYENGQKVKNARVTVRHNGILIHDDLELPNHTAGKNQEADSPGGLYLQGHGNPVVFRNIWVVEK